MPRGESSFQPVMGAVQALENAKPMNRSGSSEGIEPCTRIVISVIEDLGERNCIFKRTTEDRQVNEEVPMQAGSLISIKGEVQRQIAGGFVSSGHDEQSQLSEKPSWISTL